MLLLQWKTLVHHGLGEIRTVRFGTTESLIVTNSIDTKVGLWKKGADSESWLEGADWVVDAIDNVTTKASISMPSYNSLLIKHATLPAPSGRTSSPLLP
jgi:hypothetical protein